jgi:hypothetical protein
MLYPSRPNLKLAGKLIFAASSQLSAELDCVWPNRARHGLFRRTRDTSAIDSELISVPYYESALILWQLNQNIGSQFRILELRLLGVTSLLFFDGQC